MENPTTNFDTSQEPHQPGPTTPDAGPDPMAAATKGKAISLGVFLGSSAIFGVADIILWEYEAWETISTILDTVIGILAILTWCSYDARLHKFPLSGRFRLFIFLFAIIGVPVYLVRSRGWMAAAKIGFGVPVFLLSIAISYGAFFATEWIADRLGYFS